MDAGVAVAVAEVAGAGVAVVAVGAAARGGGRLDFGLLRADIGARIGLAVVGLAHVGAGVAGVLLRVLGRDASVDIGGAQRRNGRLRGAFATPTKETCHAQGGGHLFEVLLHDVSWNET